MAEPIRVLVADDYDLVREGLRAVVRAADGFEIVGEARDGIEAVEQARALQPDLIVMDARMPRLSGIEACREIRDDRDANILILTSYGSAKAVMAALAAGARGFILKEGRASDLVSAMETVGRGGNLLHGESVAAVLAQVRQRKDLTEEERLASQLNEREWQILDLIVEGMTNREIGEATFLSEKTVKHHVSDILGKLGLSRRVEAASFALRVAAARPSDEE